MTTAVFVDYDGTITDRDTFDVLVHACGGAQEWGRMEVRLHAGTMTHREALAEQARLVRFSLEEAEAAIAARARIEPSFPAFARACERRGVALTVLSGGIGTLIVRALARAGLEHLPVVANDAIVAKSGWQMTFRDRSDHGHDKAAAVREAARSGARTVYAGDGFSDYEGALAAGVRFAKRGRPLERFLAERGAAFTPFSDFSEIEHALFAGAALR